MKAFLPIALFLGGATAAVSAAETKHALTLDAASKMAAACIKHQVQTKYKPINVVIVDDGGNVNTGVEAARVGDAGKGSAVVAQEVRELAQRSAKAQEIKGLTNKSTSEVNSGSQFVQETGTVLAKFSAQIVTISLHVEVIARASHDQSGALQEVNLTVNQMDQMTQQNAAMVEETTAASRELASQADDLLTLVQQFKIEAGFQDSHIGALLDRRMAA